MPKAVLGLPKIKGFLMLTQPDIAEETILRALLEAYGLPITKLTFLPLGADKHTAVYLKRFLGLIL